MVDERQARLQFVALVMLHTIAILVLKAKKPSSIECIRAQGICTYDEACNGHMKQNLMSAHINICLIWLSKALFVVPNQFTCQPHEATAK